MLSDLCEALDHEETLIQTVNNDLDGLAAVREGRQKSVLLEKASQCTCRREVVSLLFALTEAGRRS